jgi:hypothetical protein
MKTNLCLSLSSLLLATALNAAPLMETTAIHGQPDAATPAIGYLKAGTDPTTAPNATAPNGWMAIELPGPHEAYVRNNDFSKSLDIHPGSAIHLLPKADAPVLATIQDGDKTEITGLRSGWTQIKLYKTVIGYIRTGGTAPATAVAAAPAPTVPPPAPAITAAPVAPVLTGGSVAGLPRELQGVLVETRRRLLVGSRPPYDYQLNDADGKRIAYLEVSKVLPTLKMELYLDRFVTVSGAITQTEDWKNLVVQVQTLEAK